MAGSLLYDAIPSWTQLLSTELNALANTSAVAQSTGTNAAYDNGNSSNRYFWADFELRVTFGSAPTALNSIDLYIVPLSSDGTNFVDCIVTSLNPKLYVDSWLVRSVTTAQVLLIRQVVLPAEKFIIVLANNSAQAFPATGSTVKMLPSREAYT